MILYASPLIVLRSSDSPGLSTHTKCNVLPAWFPMFPILYLYPAQLSSPIACVFSTRCYWKLRWRDRLGTRLHILTSQSVRPNFLTTLCWFSLWLLWIVVQGCVLTQVSMEPARIRFFSPWLSMQIIFACLYWISTSSVSICKAFGSLNVCK